MRMLLFGGILKYAINLTLSKSNLTFDASSVSYGLERMNREVSAWMNGGHDRNTIPSMPFIATKGYDSVVWSRLYSRDTSDLVDHQINQVSGPPSPMGLHFVKENGYYVLIKYTVFWFPDP